MNPSVASLICACGIAGLLYLDRERTAHCSRALWVPGIWIAIVGSRSLSQWLGVNTQGNMQLDGSPVDAVAFGVLLTIAIGVLIHRKNRTRTLLLANWPILICFFYFLVSVTWSYHPDVSFKRWIKAIGDLAMVLVIATDVQPVAAIRRLVSRIGFLLFPTSVLFIKYYGDLGRAFDPDGVPMNTGVTTNKNSLGLVVLVVSLVVLWNVRSLFIHKNEPNRGRRLLAQGTLLAFGLALFWMAHSSTCKACFVLGGFLIIASNLRAIRRRPGRMHALCLVILLAAGLMLLLDGQAQVANALGRESNISGRTDIWASVIPVVPNSIVGAGFESFWISPSVGILHRKLLLLGWYPPLVEVINEAHNGYIEVYLNSGCIGLCLITLILISGYRRALKVFHRDPELGGLFLAYIGTGTAYSITEAGFRMLTPSWIFLLIAIVTASGVAAGLFGGEKHKVSASRKGMVSSTAGSQELMPERVCVHSLPGGFNAIGNQSGKQSPLMLRLGLSRPFSVWLPRLISSVPNSIRAAGFESSWIGPDVQKVSSGISLAD
jgi:exopolysaccharide production protein ExoQ